MIALVVGEAAGQGPLMLAFAHAGFVPHGVSSPEDAARALAAHGTSACVLVLDASFFETAAGGSRWDGLLARHPELAAVVVARGPARRAAHAPERHRVLLQDPFDAAAVVAAARRASSGGPLRPGGASTLRQVG